MRKKFFLFKILPFLGFLSLIYLVQSDIYLTEEIRVNSSINASIDNQVASLTEKTVHFNVFDSITDLKNRFKKRAYAPEKANQTSLILSLNFTTLNLEQYRENCKANSNASKIFIGLMSRVDSFKRRLTIRNTLLKQVNSSDQKLLFFVAKSRNESINDQIDEESIEYNDIVKLEFIEDYYNLTLKSISFLEYFNRFCNDFKYAIKLDDDVFLNWHGMKSYLDREIMNTHPTIYCKMHSNAPVIRDVSNKWYVDWKDFQPSTFPNYCGGPSYILNREAVGLIIQENEKKKQKIIFLEDVYTTGILTQNTTIKLNDVSQFLSYWKRWYFMRNYLKAKILLIHPVDDTMYSNLYKNVKKTFKLKN